MARHDSKPRARLALSEAGLQAGRWPPRPLFFEVSPYERYGAVNPRLDWISPSPLVMPDGQRFVVWPRWIRAEIQPGKRRCRLGSA